MKIIVAGFNKTGTKSTHVALKELGYGIYDILDHFWHHNEEWLKIMKSGKGGSIDDFKKMYENVDVTIDAPSFIFWEEIHKAFPDAKIILLTRDEDSFYRSFMNQIEEIRTNYVFHVIKLITPTGWKLMNFYSRTTCMLFPIVRSSSFDFGFASNEMVVKKAFRHHQRYCEQNAPPDKLLVYSVKEGWEPLCKFLDKEIPDKPFPHANIAGTILDELVATHPCFVQIKREAFVFFATVAGLGAFATYYLMQYGITDLGQWFSSFF